MLRFSLSLSLPFSLSLTSLAVDREYELPFVLSVVLDMKKVKACGLFAAAIGVYVVITLVLAMRRDCYSRMQLRALFR